MCQGMAGSQKTKILTAIQEADRSKPSAERDTRVFIQSAPHTASWSPSNYYSHLSSDAGFLILWVRHQMSSREVVEKLKVSLDL